MSLINALLGSRNTLRFLTRAERAPLQEWMEARPACSAFALGFLDRFGMSGTRENRFFDFAVMGPDGGWTLVALIVHGVLVHVLHGDEPSSRKLGQLVLRRRQMVTMVSGRREPVLALAEALLPRGASPRSEQAQILMQRLGPMEPPVEGLPASFRKARMTDLHQVLAATLAMHEEEMGSPNTDEDVDSLMRAAYAKIQDSRSWICTGENSDAIDFKATIGTPTASGAQLEGIWTAPDRRGQGLAKRCLRGLCAELSREFPLLSLTVGAENEPALRLYRSLGFEEVMPWATVYLDD